MFLPEKHHIKERWNAKVEMESWFKYLRSLCNVFMGKLAEKKYEKVGGKWTDEVSSWRVYRTFLSKNWLSKERRRWDRNEKMSKSLQNVFSVNFVEKKKCGKIEER